MLSQDHRNNGKINFELNQNLTKYFSVKIFYTWSLSRL